MILKQSVLMWSLEKIYLDGWNFLASGMGYRSFFFKPLSHSLISLFVRMHLVWSVMVHLWTMNGSMADGLLFSSLCQLLTRNFYLLFWLPMFGAPCWSCRRILFHVDNEAVVHFLNSRTSKDPNIMHLLCSLLKVAACLSFTFAAVHVPG